MTTGFVGVRVGVGLTFMEALRGRGRGVSAVLYVVGVVVEAAFYGLLVTVAAREASAGHLALVAAGIAATRVCYAVFAATLEAKAGNLDVYSMSSIPVAAVLLGRAVGMFPDIALRFVIALLLYVAATGEVAQFAALAPVGGLTALVMSATLLGPTLLAAALVLTWPALGSVVVSLLTALNIAFSGAFIDPGWLPPVTAALQQWWPPAVASAVYRAAVLGADVPALWWGSVAGTLATAVLGVVLVNSLTRRGNRDD